jgi:hypothetical protein
MEDAWLHQEHGARDRFVRCRGGSWLTRRPRYCVRGHVDLAEVMLLRRVGCGCLRRGR